ncbi:HAMP domain-containing histidine kinase [Sphingobium sp. BHU LFT2]|uniref:sensor histidine kinase n=1 Tax=Sphingobium sp. BHU LFT2 TaxID=2807634 RepID=UPI001BEA4DE2|nr:HAMP domain-containing sensor histidine kinase [Sphingobium sp. BHU LFT2]MBT2246753.1 HAMP domain-containing histidine kinase [Sphingobium sp. BHU LFT2]
MPYALVILPIVVATFWSGLAYSRLGIAAFVLLATIHAARGRKRRSGISRSAISGRADASRHLLPPISNASSEQTDPSSDQRLLITAGVTHELRTPLTILKGRLHGIEDGVIRPDEDETARLLRQVEHVLAIVNDLDTLAQADMGRLALQRREIDLAEVVGAVVADLRPLLARHEMTIVESYEKVRIFADPTRITQIVTNLLTNASKHSSVGGHILVDVTWGAGDVQLSVMDEGPGFSAEDQDRLFTPFWRSDATIKRAGCPGTGMGLALTAKLVAAHGGKIIAENRRDRSGACFRVLLPM